MSVVFEPLINGGGGLVTKLCPTLANPWTVAHQAPLSMGFPRQEYWSGLPFPSPGHLPDPGIKTASLTSPALTGRFFTTRATWEARPRACQAEDDGDALAVLGPVPRA